ncbi:hypothetical protein Tco_0336779 [Tanacetum coccineum]
MFVNLTLTTGVVAKVSSSSSTPGKSLDVAKLKDMVKALLLDKKNQNQVPVPVKAIEESCGYWVELILYRKLSPPPMATFYRHNIQEYVSQAATANFNQGNTASHSYFYRSFLLFFDFTPFGDSDFLLEEVDAFLALKDDPTSPEVDDSYYDPEGDILLLESFLNDDPSLPPPTQGNYLPKIQKELKVCEAKTDKSFIDERH